MDPSACSANGRASSMRPKPRRRRRDASGLETFDGFDVGPYARQDGQRVPHLLVIDSLAQEWTEALDEVVDPLDLPAPRGRERDLDHPGVSGMTLAPEQSSTFE